MIKLNPKAIPYLIIAVLLLILWFNGCDSEKKTIPVDIPEVKGEFEPQKPIYIKGKDSIITRWKTKEIKTENPVNDSLALAYQKTKDSLERYKLYLNSIQIREFVNTFEDENVKIEMTGKVQGELKYIRPTYTIKPRKVDVEIPQMKFRLLAGIEFGNNTEFSDFRYKANLGLQNAKGNIFRAGYSKENSLDYVFAGYDFSVFTINK